MATNLWESAPILDQPWTGADPVTVGDEFARRVAGMTHQQIVDEYRKTKPGDHWGDYLGKVLEQQMPGETADQRDARIGKGAVSAVGKGASALGGIADVGNYGFWDEGAAALDWLLGRRSFDQGLALRRQQQNELRDANPKSYTAGQVAGAVPIVAQSALAMPAAGTGLANVATMGAIEGMGQGAAYGFGSGEGWQDRAGQALEQGLIGLALGGATPVAARGVGTGYRYLLDATQNSKPVQKATQSVWKMLQDNNLTLDQARAAISRIGKNASLGDISEGMQVEAAGTAAADSGAQSKMVPRYEARDKGMGARVKGYLDDAIGAYKDPQAIADSVSATKKSTGATYRSAKEYVVDAQPVLDELNAQIESYGKRSPIGKALLEWRDQIQPEIGAQMDMGNQLHGFKKGIKDAEDAAFRSGQGSLGSALKAVRQRADDVLKTSIPDFAEADKIWRGAQKVQEAYDYGQKELLGQNVYPGQSTKAWADMNDLEKEATLMGARAKIEMQTNGQPNAGLRTDRILSQNMNDQKVGPMIDARKPGSFKKLKGKLEGEQTQRETYNLVDATRGSRTAPVTQAANRRWGTKLETLDGLTQAVGNVATAGAAGGPGAALLSAVGQGASSLGRGILARLKQPDSATISAAGDLLSRQGPEARDTIKMIIKMLRQQGMNQKKAEALAKQLTLGGRALVPAATPQLGLPSLGGGGR